MLGSNLALTLPDDVSFQGAALPAARPRPAERLMLALLDQARLDLDLPRDALPRLDALRWLDSDDEVWPFSFVRICRHFGIDPQAGRAALRARQR